jgi:hypothetical protein
MQSRLCVSHGLVQTLSHTSPGRLSRLSRVTGLNEGVLFRTRTEISHPIVLNHEIGRLLGNNRFN